MRYFPAAALVLVFLAAAPALHAQEGAAPVQRHAAEVTGVGHLVQQVFGPMPAVAGTPFLGLAVLSGAALFSDTDFVRDSDSAVLRGFRDNALLAEVRRYSTLPFFCALIGLSLLTWLANSGKIRGAVGKLLRAAEDSSVLVTYALLAAATFLGAGNDAAPAPKVALMGVWDVPAAVVLPIGFTLALVVMMTVRYAFDVIIWLSPFPLVDFAFESLKKLLSLGFLAIYFASPTTASVLGLMVLLPALFLYGWALRILSFAFRIVLRPVLARLFPELRPVVTPETVPPAAALAVRGLRRRTPGKLQRTPDGLVFAASSRLRRRTVLLPTRLALGRALLWLELRAHHPDGRVDRIALPRTYACDFDKLCALLGAENAGSFGAVKVFGQLADGIGFRTAPTTGAPYSSSGE